MALTQEEEMAVGDAHASVVGVVRDGGFNLDYSLVSLMEVERLFTVFRGMQLDESDLRRLVWPIAAYVAEVLRRVVPEADLSSVDGELVVTLPSRIVPQAGFKLMPVVRVEKLLSYEETLYGWAIIFLGATGHLDNGVDMMAGFATMPES
jgi:hypothetical protein